MKYVEIPWEKFLKEEDRLSLEQTKVERLPVESLQITDVDDVAPINAWNTSVQRLNESVADPSFFLNATGDRTAFDAEVLQAIPMKGNQQFSDTLFDLLSHIYKKPHAEVGSLSFVSYGRERVEKSEIQRIELELNTFGDEEYVYIYPLTVLLDEQNVIQDVTFKKESTESEHSTRSLNEDAFINDETNTLFTQKIKEWLELVEAPEAKGMYAGNKETLTQLLDKSVVKLSEKSSMQNVQDVQEAMKQLLEVTQGEAVSKLTGYTHADKGANAQSTYALSVPDEERVHTFTITFDRSEGTIVNIEKEG